MAWPAFPRAASCRRSNSAGARTSFPPRPFSDTRLVADTPGTFRPPRATGSANAIALLTLTSVAVLASREVVIDAPPEIILEALADVGSVPSWSPVHRRAEVIDSYPDGRPHHVKVTIRVVGIIDTEVLEYHWGQDWLVWDADKTVQQHAQHVEYTLQREPDDKTRVRFEITLEPSVPIPEFLIKRARRKVLYAATEGLRRRVMAALGSDRST